MSYAFKVHNLHYRYPKAKGDTLKGISFSVEEGEIFGFLGPSGAGKSTTQKVLIKLLEGYSGEIRYFGRDLQSIGKSYYEEVGVGFEMPIHFSKMTALENLNYFSGFYKNRIDFQELMERVGLWEHKDVQVGNYSKGMKVRLNFVRAMLNNPRMLFLDEPTAGIDPKNARILKDIISEYRAQGGTVFLTTHLMNDVDELCDHVVFGVDGNLTDVSTPPRSGNQVRQTRGQSRVQGKRRRSQRCIPPYRDWGQQRIPHAASLERNRDDAQRRNLNGRYFYQSNGGAATMTNILRLIGGEFKRLVNYKLLARSLVTGLVWVLVFLLISKEDARDVAPMLMFVDVSIVLMMLLGASFYLEQQENTIKSMMVLPVSVGQILLSKTVSSLVLTLVTVAITCTSVYLIHAISFNYALLLLFVILAALAHAALGFTLALSGKSFDSMLIMVIVYVVIFAVPSILLAMDIIDVQYEWMVMVSPSHAARLLFSSVVSGEYDWGKTLFSCTYLSFLAGMLMRFVVYPKFKSRAVKG